MEPVDISTLTAAQPRPSLDLDTGSSAKDAAPLQASAEQLLCAAFSSGDALYLSLLLHCPHSDVEVRRFENVSPGLVHCAAKVTYTASFAYGSALRTQPLTNQLHALTCIDRCTLCALGCLRLISMQAQTMC